MVVETPQATEPTSPQLIHGLKLSSVVPAKITGDNRDRKLTGMDLALKLHYLRGVYFFHVDAGVSLGIDSLKEPMSRCIELYYPSSGRIRRADNEDEKASGGRPFVKCNDGGVRIVEARSDKTVDEWLDMEDHAEIDDKVLVYDQVLGPDLGFSPLVFIQFTWFKCGGISVGLSWAHVLGDAFSASSFINMWAHIMAGHVPPDSLHVPCRVKAVEPPGTEPGPLSSLRQVEPVGDYWKSVSDRKMRTLSIHISEDQLDRLVSSCRKCSTFHVMSAVIWKSLARIRGEEWPRVVNICTSSCQGKVDKCLPGNYMTVGTVEADFSVTEADVSELATWMVDHKREENRQIEETVGRDNGKSDYILYGANLTFVNLEESDIYGLALKGQCPTYANYTINGVGDEGLVLILPQRVRDKGRSRDDGRTVTVTLPGNEALELKKELRKDPKFL